MASIGSFRDFIAEHSGILILSPFWALVAALLACVLYARFGTPRLLAAAALWIAYIPYELSMLAGIFCQAECRPRVDLLPAYGILWAVTLIALGEVVIIAVHDLWLQTRPRSGTAVTPARAPTQTPSPRVAGDP